MTRLLSRAQVAERLQVPVATLARWAYTGDGPPYARLGKHARYDEHDLEVWIAGKKKGRP